MLNKIIFIVSVFSIFFFGCPDSRPALIVSANLTGANEVPPVNALAAGSFVGVVGVNSDFMQSQLFVSCIDSVLFAHLHYAAEGVNGPIIVTLFHPEETYTNPQKRLAVDLKITKELFEGPAMGWTFEKFIEEILAGNVYVNTHTVRNPGGETRGQVEKFR